jgi:hypothetical protein
MVALKTERRVFLWRVSAAVTPPSVDRTATLAEIVAILDAREEHFETVSFNIEQLPGNRTSNPTLDLSDIDALDQLYVRAQRLTDFSIMLEACYATICPHIDYRMKALVNDDTLW